MCRTARVQWLLKRIWLLVEWGQHNKITDIQATNFATLGKLAAQITQFSMIKSKIHATKEVTLVLEILSKSFPLCSRVSPFLASIMEIISAVVVSSSFHFTLHMETHNSFELPSLYCCCFVWFLCMCVMIWSYCVYLFAFELNEHCGIWMSVFSINPMMRFLFSGIWIYVNWEKVWNWQHLILTSLFM